MNRLRVVIVMVEPPLPFGDATARWFYVLYKGLVDRGHDVTCFATYSKPASCDEARTLFPTPRFDLRLYPVSERRGLRGKLDTLRRPFSYLFSEELRSDLEATLARGYDILDLEQLWCGWLALGHVDRTLLNVHYLLRIDQSEDHPSTWKGRAYKALGIATEARLIRRYRHIRACSPRIADAVHCLNPLADVSAVPLGIDVSLYPYIPDADRGGPPVITLIGSMHWGPSRSSAYRLLDRLWPEIHRRVPTARLRIIGWKAREALADRLDREDVEILENVPDTRPYFEATSVFVYAPGRGSGMKIKIQEAMAYGIPVVTTSEGTEGLPAVDGVHAGICDDDGGLIERTVALLGDVAAQNRQRSAARELLESVCGPGPTVDAVEALYAKICNPMPPEGRGSR
ncbi:MAG: glycosyltransferase family 4 protein [Isosphaeraceae bacterium]